MRAPLVPSDSLETWISTVWLRLSISSMGPVASWRGSSSGRRSRLRTPSQTRWFAAIDAGIFVSPATRHSGLEPASLAVEGTPEDGKIPWGDYAALNVKVAKAPQDAGNSHDFYRRKAAKVARTGRLLRERQQLEATVEKPWEEQAIPELDFGMIPRVPAMVLMAPSAVTFRMR